jgi:hypothetical protein
MLLTIRHWIGVQLVRVTPFDWTMLGVEVLVLVVITYEAVYRPWKTRRWLRTVYQCFSNGQTIQQSVPTSHGGSPEDQEP